MFAKDKKTLLERVNKVCQLADMNGVSFSAEKFFMGQKTIFAGFEIDCSDETPTILPDPEKIRALSEMEAPSDKTELRSFLGMINAMTIWHPDCSYQTSNLKQLLRKDSAFKWTQTHQQEFVAIKEAMCHPNNLKPFDPALETDVWVDASQTKGVGFILTQKNAKGKVNIVFLWILNTFSQPNKIQCQ